MMVDTHEKDWVNHIIVASGIIVAIFIIIGFINSIRSFYGGESTKNLKPCEQCLTIEDNNLEASVELGSEFTLRLPEEDYPLNNVVVVEVPSGTVERMGEQTSGRKGDWAITFRAVQPGKADIIIKSRDTSEPDYHLIFYIE